MLKNKVKMTLALMAVMTVNMFADDGSDVAEMARKLQDPLANIKMVMFDNGVDFQTGNDDISYSFSVQPVYAIPMETYNLILRGVIPIVGLSPGAQKPIIGEPLPPGRSDTWGISDSQLQMFFSPKSDSDWKWGVGPLISLKTHTDAKLEGAGWGGGAAAVLVGSFSENISFSMVAGHTEGEHGFSTSFVQPMLYYNVSSIEGMAISYNNTSTYNHQARSKNAWTVPLGMTVSRTFVMESGIGLDLGIGYYNNVKRPKGAADWTLKWSVAIVFP